MNGFLITTENTADLPADFVSENGIKLLYMPVIIRGNVYNGKNMLSDKAFYEMMQDGAMPVTSQPNREEIRTFLESALEKTPEILHIGFSSGLSGTANSIASVAREIMEERPDVRIIVVDSLCASLGEGLLVYKAVQMKKEGKSLDETAAWAEEHRKNVCHNFTVNDLFHLMRGGRVSRTAAILGTMANIKPVLHVDDEGHLTAVGKVRGRKHSIQTIVDQMVMQLGSWKDKNDIIFICHSACREDAEYLKKIVEEKTGYHRFIIGEIGPTIGAHSGPGTIAVFFMGEKR